MVALTRNQSLGAIAIATSALLLTVFFLTRGSSSDDNLEDLPPIDPSHPAGPVLTKTDTKTPTPTGKAATANPVTPATPSLPPADAARLDSAKSEKKAKLKTLEDADKMGKKLFAEKKYTEAAVSFTTAIEIAETMPSLKKQLIILLNNRSAMYERAGNTELALADCDTVLDLDATSHKARTKRSRILENTGKFDEALAELCAVQLKFMHDNKDKMRMGIDVGQPPVDQAKMEEVCEKCLPSNLAAANLRKAAFQEKAMLERDLNLPTPHTIDMFLESFASYETWVAAAKKDEVAALSMELAREGIEAKERCDLLFRRGRRMAADKNYKSAYHDFKDAAAAGEGAKMLDVAEWLGIFKHLTYDLPGALKAYCGVLEARKGLAAKEGNQKVADIYVKIAGIYMDMGETQLAKTAFDDSLAAVPNYPDALLHRSNLHLQAGDIKSAHEDIELCLKLEPDFLSAVLRQVTLCMHEQNIDGAKKFLEAAAKMAPRNSDVQIYLGELAFTTGDVAGALKCFEKSLKFDPKNPNAYVNAALAILNQQPAAGEMPDFFRAKELLQKGIDIDPQFQGAYVHLGQLNLTLAQNVTECKDVVDLYDAGMNHTKTEGELKELLRMRIMAEAQYQAALALNIMQYMQMGLQAMSVANGLAGLANMFFPMVPGAVVPKGLIVKEQGVVDGLNKEADYGEDNGGAKRGRELRDFELFLQEHDKDKLYAGLKRVCNEAEGCAIWVTEESLGKIERGEGETGDRLATARKKIEEAKKVDAELNPGNIELLVEMGNEIMG